MKVEADSGGMYGQKNCRHACRSFSRLHGPGGFIPDVNPLICIIAGGVLGFALPIVSIIAAILFLLVGSGYGKERRRR